MSSNDYHFVTTWRVAGTAQEVYDIVIDIKTLPRWWPSVYLEALEIQSGGPEKVDKVVRLATKGWLPYTLTWHLTLTEADPPNGFSLRAWGDFEGTGEWTFVQDGNFVDVTYDWRIRAQKALLKLGSPFFKPVFAMNHRWAMARGEESLKLELLRRRARSEAERAALPAPPRPVPAPPAPVVIVLGLVAALLIVRSRRRR